MKTLQKFNSFFPTWTAAERISTTGWCNMWQGREIAQICGHGVNMVRNPSRDHHIWEAITGAAAQKGVQQENKWKGAIWIRGFSLYPTHQSTITPIQLARTPLPAAGGAQLLWLMMWILFYYVAINWSSQMCLFGTWERWRHFKGA